MPEPLSTPDLIARARWHAADWREANPRGHSADLVDVLADRLAALAGLEAVRVLLARMERAKRVALTVDYEASSAGRGRAWVVQWDTDPDGGPGFDAEAMDDTAAAALAALAGVVENS